jgi:nickel-dependent lactate racemase
MQINLAYGKQAKILEILRDNVSGIIYPRDRAGVYDPLEKVRDSLKHPIGSPTLREILSKFESPKVVIILNDIT